MASETNFDHWKVHKLLNTGPDMAAELKDGDRAEGGAESEGGLPKRSFGGQAAGFWGTSLLGFKDLHAVI